MRTVPFSTIYEGVLDRLGLDPIGDAIDYSAQRSIARKATLRVKSALDMWDWAEFSRTEERAFRTVWRNDRQFLRVGEDGQPDELYYLPNQTYYIVNADAPADPPVGEVPPGSDYYDELTPEPFIARDQSCRPTMGTVLGVYNANPTANGWLNPNLSFQPSERGIRVLDVNSNYPWWFAPNPPLPASPPTVYVWYTIPPPEYSMVPYVTNKNYQRGDRVYFAPPLGDGNCYRALEVTTAIPSDTFFWVVEPVPYALADYIEAGVYADCLSESVNGEPPTQAALQAAAVFEEEAQSYLRREIDKLHAQGQKHFYGSAKNWRYTGAWSSQPWGGDKVIALTDVCEQDWVFPPTPEQPQVREILRTDIVSFYGALPNVVGVPTRLLLPGSIIKWVEGVSGSRIRQEAQLLSGPANALDPGQKNPNDYDATTNSKHWELIG